MTFTLNGVGTMYYGKRKKSTRTKQCENCGRVGVLSTYDTTKFFVLVYIPLIPLGRFHVLDDCPSCRRHRLISEKDWRQLTETTLAETTDVFRRQPNRETAFDLINLLQQLNLAEDFQVLAPELEQRAGEDATYWGVLAGTAQQFGDEAMADRCYRRSRQYEDLPWVRAAWSWLLVLQGRIDEARGQILPPDAQGENVDLHLALVEGLLAAGRHEEAAIELRNLAVQVPGLAKDKRHKKLSKAAEKYRGTGKKLTSFAPRPLVEKRRLDPTEARPVFIFALLALVVGVFAVGTFVSSSYEEVWVLNGLEEAYVVRVGDQELQLAPGQPQKVTLPTREKLKVVADFGKKKEDFEIEIDVPWEEIFDYRTLVLNPDQVALLREEEELYYPEGLAVPQNVEGSRLALLTGSRLYQKGEIDFLFRDFPETVKLSGKKPEWRSRLATETLTPAAYFSILRQHLGAKVVERQMERYSALIEPDESVRLSWLATLPPE